ncbi:dephospho-CoA kinase [Methylomarinum sp. Ch1-1]|uniref:Dephospho-CoA kinase n=1 Tax=Methylomarinum roseum TaxID=3067653 RepID=A0AAU7NXW5_9GAMM|nr:dephospho-CoA kinase [Methylomarinum sp. Ch1-1]MDP4522089.1 dephospho-CoA kinase [Methylomarinum sp. Ch1-1]
MLRIGLTGGIGCGKSTVSKLFQQLGAPVIDADVIAHSLVTTGQPALRQLENAFGSEIINADGSLDRAALRERVFAEPAEKKKLENILHPLIYAQIEAEIRQLRAPYCIVSIPLLLETNMTTRIDRVLVIDCPVETQIARVKQRDGLSTELINRIIASQVSRDTRLSRADDIIDNSKTPRQLAEQVKKLHNLYLKWS